ncbi:MAG: SRPBCC family protein [Longimicrobiales bacterium]
MIHNERSLGIDATPEEVWAVLGRYMHMHEFAPRIESIDALTEGEDGVGSQRRCNFADGTSVVEEVTEWEANRFYRVRLVEMGPMPVKEAHATLSVEPLDENRSSMKMAMDYRMKFGPVGWLMGQTMMKSMMGKIFEGVLAGLSDKVRSERAA